LIFWCWIERIEQILTSFDYGSAIRIEKLNKYKFLEGNIMEAGSKALEIMEVFLKTDSELSIYDVAKLTGIKPSTAYRVTYLLVNKGYVYQRYKRGKYSMSPKKLFEFAGLAKRKLNVRIIALPFLHDLTKETGYSSNMALCLGKVGFDYETINPSDGFSFAPSSRAYDLYNSAVGKVFLAYMHEKELQEYFETTKLISKTPNTISELKDLKIQLEHVKQEGVAFDYEEAFVGLNAIAAPVWDSDGNVAAAIGIFGSSVRLTRQKTIKLAPIVKKYALDISKAMGYNF
jgi:IclR family transcriptional regulator, KDG regulon repressor